MKVATVFLALTGFFVLAIPAQAYLDPASGSLLLQILLGGIAGLMLLIKMDWQRLRKFLGLRPREEEPAE